MSKQLELMGILAHPDDESMGTGGIMAKYAAEGVETYLLTATRGEKGWFGPAEDYPGPEALGRVREGELLAAARVLGLKEVSFLDYIDGELENASMPQLVGKIARHIRRVRPDVVVTFDPYGVYGHLDHIIMCQAVTAAIVAAASPAFDAEGGLAPHSVSKLYYMVWTEKNRAAFEAGFGELVMEVKGEKRRAPTWQDWAVTTRIDTTAYWRQVWEAVACHRSQLPAYGVLKDLPEEHQRTMWGDQTYYRAFSLVNGGAEIETDLFEGLRDEVSQGLFAHQVAAD